ncbi:IS5 family transposase [Streptosporangium longisporum]|uniref:Insertion element IS402-like domain-containing protein n=1 Tax=Streptosporangium longisporum TaxID=46187 RepID=A0ABN3Y458_9ACTN
MEGSTTKKNLHTGDLVTTLAVTRRFDLTDEQWAALQPLLPVAKKPGRPSQWTKRQLIDGIRWRVRVGAPWRDVPECYGSWQAVYSLFRRWRRSGIWRQIVYGLQITGDAQGLIGWEVGVDSTSCRAHQHAAGASTKAERQAEPPGGVDAEPADHALGRSRGGLSTKLHLACEQGQKLLSLVLTAGVGLARPIADFLDGRRAVARTKGPAALLSSRDLIGMMLRIRSWPERRGWRASADAAI